MYNKPAEWAVLGLTFVVLTKSTTAFVESDSAFFRVSYSLTFCSSSNTRIIKQFVLSQRTFRFLFPIK
jgi:hypothetical protein